MNESDGIPVGRELRLAEILSSSDVMPILMSLSSGGISEAAVYDDKGEILWTSRSDSSRLLRMDEIARGRLEGPGWKAARLNHEGETIGYFFIASHPEGPNLDLISDVSSACFSSMVRNNSKRILTSEIHTAVVDQSYEELVDANKRLSASELKYRELSESLQIKVDEKTEELKKAFARMLRQDKLSSIGQLAAGVAHEINNPTAFIYSNLNTFMKYMKRIREIIPFYRKALSSCAGEEVYSEAEALYNKLKIDFILGDCIDLIAQSAEGAHRIKQIVADLKDFSHIDDSDESSVDLNSEIEKVLSMLKHRINEQKTTLVRQFGSIPRIKGEPSSIGLVFLNIIINALESMDGETKASGERGLIITISTALTSRGVAISVGDNGRGIPADIRERIFDPFFTTKDVGQGSGMGLTVSSDIIYGHEGDIDVRSEEGKGTTVVITFPVKEASS